jgi:hypothetical protein
MRCDTIADTLAEAAEGTIVLDPASARHVEACLRCQAELVQYRKLLRALHAMRAEVLNPVPGLLADILATLEAAGERHAIRSMITGKRVAYLGGVVVATAAGATGAILLGRSKRRIRIAG